MDAERLVIQWRPATLNAVRNDAGARPRFGRLLTWTLPGAGIDDLLQAGFAALTHKASELEQDEER